ncbi:MAG: helix-turn-helix transcriptional regulator [Planctomycetes bacterium]|nr:helix-turn-helix transcriptional regulator [Planctomycetota bacterium]
MATATQDPRAAAMARAAQSAVEASLSIFEVVPADDRESLKRMLCEFLDSRDAEVRREVFVSIIEFLSPERYFNVAESLTVDEWITSDRDTTEAIARLTERKKQFGDTLSRLMAEKGLKQRDLAVRLGVKQPAVSALVKGQHKPQPRTLNKLAKALRVKPTDLWPD